MLQFKEPMPEWLRQFNSGDDVSRDDFFSDRTVFYPGSSVDGQAVKLFGSSHSCHCFVYADYGTKKDYILEILENPDEKFKGYHQLARVQLTLEKFMPEGWVQHVSEIDIRDSKSFANVPGYGFIEILERDSDMNNEHGAERLAILFLGADGIATYDALYCQKHSPKPPYGILLQDHGFGGNYDRFGNGGLMHRIARRTQTFPEWLVVAIAGTESWFGYEPVAGVEGDRAGMHFIERKLHQKTKDFKMMSLL